MNSNQEIQSLDKAQNDADSDDPISVDEFIRQLEAKEKDLHITAETTVIEIAESFDDVELPEFMKEEFQEKPVKSSKAVAADKEKLAKAAHSKLEAEVKQLKEKVARLEDERAEMSKDAQRRVKDFSNYKARVERERRETFQNQVANLAIQMLPALDNLNRAIDFVEFPQDQESEFRHFFDGVVLVNQQVNDVLAGMGIEPIATIGERFDPHLHEAAATEETNEVEPNTVTAEMLKGYKMGERVIRHSIVRVAKPALGSSETAEPEASEPEMTIEPESIELELNFPEPTGERTGDEIEETSE